MDVKEKACKGKGLAKGNGCGKVGFHHSMHKGLCSSCWPYWLLNTKEGKNYMDRVKLKAKKEVAHEKRKQKAKAKKDLLSVDAYRSKILQPVINEIARLIDFGQPCIATGLTTGKFSGGHFTSVGANRLIALNIHNIHIQSYHSNGPKGGQPIEYMQGLRSVYSQPYADFIIDLRKYKRMQSFRKHEFEEAYKIAIKIRNKLRRNKVKRTPKQRIRLRNIVNRVVGLYPKSVFNVECMVS